MSARRGHFYARVGLFLVLCWTLALAQAAAAGRHGSHHGSSKARVAELLAAADAQGSAGDLRAARASLEQAYKLQPGAEILCALATLAARDGRLLDAQDARRRCAASGSTGATGEPTAAPADRPESGELTVLGPRRALVLVDEHVMGVLPLTTPLLLAPGPHHVTLEVGARRVESEVKVLAGRAALLTLAGPARVMLMPAAALLVDFTQSPEAAGPLLYQAAAQAVQNRRLGLLGKWGAVAANERLQLGSCPDATCQRTLAQRYALRYVVAARAVAEPDGWQLWAQLFDAEIGSVASEQASDCERCTRDQASARLGELVAQALMLGQSRPTGILEVTSIPPGGEVLLAGLRLGQTPLRHPAFAGEHAIVVQRPGFLPYQNEVVVEPGRGAALDALLHESSAEAAPPSREKTPPVPEPPSERRQAREPALPSASPARPVPRSPGRAPRPRWRLGLGIGASAVGAVLSGLGIAGLALDGSCTQTPLSTTSGQLCPSGRVVDSRVAGAGLVAAGLSALGAGTILWAVPGARTMEVSLAWNVSPNRSATVGVAVHGSF